jgi:hypothetical protein
MAAENMIIGAASPYFLITPMSYAKLTQAGSDASLGAAKLEGARWTAAPGARTGVTENQAPIRGALAPQKNLRRETVFCLGLAVFGRPWRKTAASSGFRRGRPWAIGR